MFGLSFLQCWKKVKRSYPCFFCLRGELCWKARLTGTSGMALNFKILVVASLGARMLQSCWAYGYSKIFTWFLCQPRCQASGVTVIISRGAPRHTATSRNRKSDFMGNEGFALQAWIPYKMTIKINQVIPYKMNSPNPAKFSKLHFEITIW